MEKFVEGRKEMARIEKSGLKSAGAESVVVDKFPLQRGAASRTPGAFAELLGRQLAIDFRPEEPRRALCRAESGCVDRPGSCIPGGAILSGKPVPSERGSVPAKPVDIRIQITRPCATTVQKSSPSALVPDKDP